MKEKAKKSCLDSYFLIVVIIFNDVKFQPQVYI